MTADRYEYPTTAADCYIDSEHLDEHYATHADALLLDAAAAANFVASLISSFTADEVDGDGDAWSIVCEHLSTLLGNLSAALHRPEGEPVRAHLYAEYGLDPNDLRTDDEKTRDRPSTLAPAHIIARLLMEEAADRIEAMQNAGAAMARRLDELEPGPFGDDVEEELETIATGTVSAGLLRLELEGPPPPDGTRVAVIIIPDTIDVVPS